MKSSFSCKKKIFFIKPHTHTHTHLLNYFLFVFSLFYIFLFVLFFFYISFFPFLINKPQHFVILYFDADVDKRNLKIRKQDFVKKKWVCIRQDMCVNGGRPEADSGMGIITREFFFHRENMLQREVVHHGTGVIISVGCA